MPGVSMKTSWLRPFMAMPRTGTRVVCTLCETIETLQPTSALTSVDLPAFVAPKMAMKPQRRLSPGLLPCTTGCTGGFDFLDIGFDVPDAFARE